MVVASMVFSFFKKPTEKMVAKPAAVPRAKSTSTDSARTSAGQSEATASSASDQALAASAPHGAETYEEPPSSIDFVFSEGDGGFQVEEDIDPVDAEAEEAAVLFANGQDDAARAVLESAVRVHQYGPGERLWLMLFDLYRLTGQKAPFEALEIAFVQTFEKSPPGWLDASREKPKAQEKAAGSVLFRGALVGSNDAGFLSLRQAIEAGQKLRVDLSKIPSADAEGCGQLLQLLASAKRAKREVELLGKDELIALIGPQIESGRPDNRECWLLLLELLQLQGKQEDFDETAINFAITFEVSPPSWEEKRVAAPEPEKANLSGAQAVDKDAYAMTGEIKNSRFGDLGGYADVNDPVVIDCVGLRRIDFISAGALLNVLSSVRRGGKQIVFRFPNRMVAELFRVIGLKAVATFVFTKH